MDREAFPFRSRFLAIAHGRRVHYIDEGEGEVLLFVHGTPTWSFEWRHCIRALSRTHRCVAMDNLGFGLSDRPRDFDYRPESHAAVLRAFVERLELRDVTLVVHDFGGPIGLPLALGEASVVRRLVVLNTWMWSFRDDPDMIRKARMASGTIGRLLYRYANFSLRVLTPYAYGDRTKLTPRIHQQYLAPFRDPESRERVLWPLARAMLGSGRYYDSLWLMRDRLKGSARARGVGDEGSGVSASAPRAMESDAAPGNRRRVARGALAAGRVAGRSHAGHAGLPRGETTGA